MKLLKIGSSPACDIVINDKFVSSLHAELTILDNGEMVLEDKNSSNGTFVGNKKIVANTETPIRRGDLVRLANTPLPWGRIPTPASNSMFKQIVNIGSSFRNDLIVSNGTVSRYHATMKIDKGGKVYICDNDSKNGTQINGVKIQPSKNTRIKRGDNVMVGGEDITEQLAPYFPKSYLKTIVGIAAAITVTALLGLAAWLLWPIGGPERFQPAVVYIQSAYHYEASVENFSFRYPADENEYKYASATGFFVDRNGRIATARHAAVPWDEAYSKEIHEQLKSAVQEYIHSQLLVSEVTTSSDLARLRSTAFGEELYQKSESLPDINGKIARLLSGDVKITGEMDFFAVGYSGNNYESLSEFQRCTLIAESGDAKKDVALLQLNDKTTPSFIKDVFDLSKVTDKPLKPMKDILYTIGYPHGFLWNYASNDKELKNSIRETKCSKVPNKYDFEFQATSQSGASGSPVYLKNGQLVGILSQVYATDNGPTIAAHAYFLKQLYEENTGAIAK